MLRHLRILFIVMACVALASVAWAEQPAAEQPAAEQPATEQPAAEDTAAPGADRPVYGMQMWIDQETGVLRAPTQEEAARLSSALQSLFAGEKAAPRVRTDKSGMMAVELDERMLEFSVVRVEADGSLTRDCVDDAQQALEFIAATPTSQTEQEDE